MTTPQPLRRRRTLMLSGVSAVALMLTHPAVAQTLGGLRSAMGAAGVPGPNSGVAAPSANIPGLVVTPTQAAQRTAQSTKDLNSAIAALKFQLNQQANTHAALLAAPSTAPNGLAPGGLQVAPGVGTDPTLWLNANAPTQTTDGSGHTTVTIQQTAQKSILTWDSFSVGKDTTVHFDQTGGDAASGNSWISLNRVIDPTGVPSTILGQIKAEGTVYLMNHNGVIFGGSSQVNVHSLLASSLPFIGAPADLNSLTPGTQAYRDAVKKGDKDFLANGIGNLPNDGGIYVNEPALGTGTNSVQQPNFYSLADVLGFGDVTVEAGAQVQVGNLGYAIMVAPHVSNAGTILAPGGQILLASGMGATITESSPFLSLLMVGQVPVPISGIDSTPVFTVENTGVLQAPTGQVQMQAENVIQNGVIEATTSIARGGSVNLAASSSFLQQTSTGNLTIGPKSLIAILPEEDGATVTSGPGAHAATGGVTFSGAHITMEGGSSIEAPSGSVSTLGTPQRVYIADGVTIDVAGLADVERPISDTLVTISKLTANDLADAPLDRDGFLISQTVTIDGSVSGTRADGETWVGSPILDAQGYLNNVPRTIDQMMVNGGSINLRAGELIAAPGSLMNLAGGYTHYLGGVINTTRVVDATGRIIDISQANPEVPIVGLAGQTSVNHGRWGVTDTYSNPLLANGGSRYESDYVQGGDGGTLNIFSLGNGLPLASGVVVLQGAIQAGAEAGRHQVGSGALPSGGSLNVAMGSGIEGEQNFTPGDSIIVNDKGSDIFAFDPDFGADTSLRTPQMLAKASNDPTNLLFTSVLSGDLINSAGFSSVALTTTAGFVTVDAPLTVTPGGSITVAGAVVNVNADLTARGGKIAVTASGVTDGPDFQNGTTAVVIPGDLTIGAGVVLDASGRWVNDSGLAVDQQGGSAFINGGSIALATIGSTERDSTSVAFDATGSIRLEAGSVLDVSSGGYVQSNGLLKASGGVAAGKGGDISLSTYTNASSNFLYANNINGIRLPATQPTLGRIEMDGTLRGYGFSGGGTLTLQALDIEVGGDPADAPAYALNLPANFFAGQGFGAYNLTAFYDAGVASGATVAVTERNLMPTAALLQAPTAADLYGAGASLPDGVLASVGALDPYHRQATNLSLTAGVYKGWQSNPPVNFSAVTGNLTIGSGAAVVADPGADITLVSNAGIVDLGSVTALGGAIDLEVHFANTVNGPNLLLGTKVWLGADAVLDASGVALFNPLAPIVAGSQLHTGTVLAGGTVTLLDEGGYVVAEPGSRIDVSGAAAVFDLPVDQQGARTIGYAPGPVWSDAGSIVIGSSFGLMFDGTLIAHGGAPQAAGGTLTLTSGQGGGPGFQGVAAKGIILQQSGTFVPTDLQPDQAIQNATPNVEHFAIDRLDGSGIDSLIVAADPTGVIPLIHGVDTASTSLAFTIAFAGDVSINLGRSFLANAVNFVALPEGATTLPTLAEGQTSVGGTTVSITAPYVAMGDLGFGFTSFSPVLALADATLKVNAATIDLTGRFGLQNFGDAVFTSSGDIRLYTPLADQIETLVPGELVTPGDITFKAAQVYPVTAEAFIVDAVGPTVDGARLPTTLTILPNGASSAPLSAAGGLLLDATDIVQAGTLRAPDGSIVIGVSDPAAQAADFNNLPTVVTQSVTLAPGSVTSVSLENQVLPYGTTVDGVDWLFTPLGQFAQPDILAPPAKSIRLGGQVLTLAPGATVDLSGGGDLQASEWVAGTGGTRNLLLSTNSVFTSGVTPTPVPLFADGRNVYAVIPGYKGPVAPIDPEMTPSAAAVGQQVYLSGVAGLPAGVYTLLPAQYATLPGAFRVVQQSGTADTLASQNMTLADGTRMVSGYYVDGFDGARAARTTTFSVQSADVWGQYSEYRLTSANSYFPQLAAENGTATPRLPIDAGRLTLAANSGLTLGAALNTAAGSGGRGAQVDIASQDIQVIGDGEAARAGYLQVTADALASLNAESLLLGGVRTGADDGSDSISALANSIVVSTDAAHPLTSPEVILVTKTDASGTDPNAANGLLVESGSVIQSKGTVSAGSDVPLTIGRLADPVAVTPAISGDGALLRVSNGSPVVVTRLDVPGVDGGPGPALGLLDIRAGAAIVGGRSITLDSAGALLLDAKASFNATAVDVDANAISFVAADSTARPGGFVVGAQVLAQFASIADLGLHARSTIDFYGDVDIAVGGALTLGAGAFVSDGGKVSISGSTVAFVNDLGAAVPAFAAGTGALTVQAGELDLGSGAKTVQGFGAITLNASQGIVGQGAGSFNFGSLDVTLVAPVVLADTGSQSTLTTTGALTVHPADGVALSRAALGGSLTLTGGSLTVDGAIQATSGKVALNATGGDLTLDDGASVGVAGLAKTFFDLVAYAPGGDIALSSATGSVVVNPGATLDFSAAAGGGNAGSLTLSAPQGAVSLQGALKGGAAAGFQGGAFSLDTGGTADLDALAVTLSSSGVNKLISVHTRTGNLTLSADNTLTASAVVLTADGGAGGPDPTGGNVIVDGKIDASGPAGGSIVLTGRSGVDLEGSLLAVGSDPTQLGGDVEIGVGATSNGAYNAAYGYQTVTAAGSGRIVLGANARIDVSGGSATTLANDGLTGGTVSLRAPILDDGSVAITVAMANPGAQIVGARSVTLEPYAVWSATDATTGAQHFDSLVDPAGWYDASGQLRAGTFTDQAGNAITYTPGSMSDADLAQALSNDFFTPDTANPDHAGFYQTTLVQFVQNPGLNIGGLGGLPNLLVTPGIELDNPADGPNHGDISILTNWNLGAGSDPATLAYRFNGQAPIITLRAAGDLKVKASLSDGFWQYGVLSGAGATVPLSDFGATDADFTTTFSALAEGGSLFGLDASGFLFEPANDLVGDPTAISQYYGLYQEYLDFLNTPGGVLANALGVSGATVGMDIVFGQVFAFTSGEPSPPTPPTTAAGYPSYLARYKSYFTLVDNDSVNTGGLPFDFTPPAPPPTTLDVIHGGAPVDNTASPAGNAANQLPMASANLAGGSSSSYRLVAGADLHSADVLSVQAAAIMAASGRSGDLTVDGHFIWADSGSGDHVAAPTMIRTGTGSISIATAHDVVLADPLAPGVIYTAGRPADGSNEADTVATLTPGGQNLQREFLVTGEVHPVAAGDLTIRAGGDVIGNEQVFDTDGVLTGTAGTYLGSFWWPWMATGNPTGASSINFAAFNQGLMSVGGNVSVMAGGTIRELSVSLPTTWRVDTEGNLVTLGQGNLVVAAAGDILSGSYFVSRGSGTISAGGEIASDFDMTVVGGFSQVTGQPITNIVPVSTLIGVQDGMLSISARGTVDIGGVYNPSWLVNPTSLADSQSMSARSSLSVFSTTGDVKLDTLTEPDAFFGNVVNDAGNAVNDAFLPASLAFTAFNGGIVIGGAGNMFPSATGGLTLVADQSIQFYNALDRFNLTFGLSDRAPSDFPNPLTYPLPPGVFNSIIGFNDFLDPRFLNTTSHDQDPDPVRIYSLNGDIVDGAINPRSHGFEVGQLILTPGKPALIEAGHDIVGLSFAGQNDYDSDVTRIVAGHDIYDKPLGPLPGRQLANGFDSYTLTPLITLAGPGYFDIEAGRNVGPLTSANEAADKITNNQSSTYQTGIQAIGDIDNAFLPHDSANITVLFGIGQGMDSEGFADAYLAPGAVIPGVAGLSPEMVAYVQQIQQDDLSRSGQAGAPAPLTVAQAWAVFQALPRYQQQALIDKSFFSVLTQVGRDYNSPDSPYFHQYSRGYTAINTLFPASMGYTQNTLDGGANGANELVPTGSLDMRGSTIQTQEGGDIDILGPGGRILVGSASAPPYVVDGNGFTRAGPNQQGILTLETGDVNIFSDDSLLLAQSRIFTEQGGNVVIWSSNGDIDAGEGLKTTADTPPLLFNISPDGFVTLDAKGEVTGAGIATLQTKPDSPTGNAFLIAPRGTVDAGAAGIRVSGDLFIAALHVANAFNIDVKGQSFGVPAGPTTNLALATPDAAAKEAVKVMQDMNNQNRRQSPDSIVTVEVVGFGGDGDKPTECISSAAGSCSPAKP